VSVSYILLNLCYIKKENVFAIYSKYAHILSTRCIITTNKDSTIKGTVATCLIKIFEIEYI